MGDLLFLGGLRISALDRVNSAELLIAESHRRKAAGERPYYSTSANGQVIAMCASSAEMRGLFNLADVVNADGMPLVMASRLFYSAPLNERVATTDLFHDAAEHSRKKEISFFFLGGTEEINRRAVERSKQLYPNLVVSGHHHGYFRSDDEPRLVEMINAAAPDILWVSMGVPHEQRFVARNLSKFRNVGAIKTGGGLFDFVAEKNKRAPAWMQAYSLEWLYRMLLEPRRLFWRYFLTNPHAAWLLLTRSGISSEGRVGQSDPR